MKNAKELYMYVLGAFIVLGAFAATIVAMIKSIPVTNHDIVVMGIGQIFIMAAGVVGYFFGSSKSSADKNELLKSAKADEGDDLTADTFYRINDDVVENGKTYICIAEYLTTQTLTPASLDSDHWKLK